MPARKTLFLNPPSYNGFDGGAGARYQAKREVRSFWYPTWLAQPAALVPDSRLIDAPARGLSLEEILPLAADYELAVLHTSTPSFRSDVRVAEALEGGEPEAGDRARRRSRRGLAGGLACRLDGSRLRCAQRVRFHDRRGRAGTASRGNRRLELPQCGRIRPQPRARHPRRHGPASFRHRRLPARPRRRGLLPSATCSTRMSPSTRGAAAARNARSVSGRRRSEVTAIGREAPRTSPERSRRPGSISPRSASTSSMTIRSPTTGRAPKRSRGAWRASASPGPATPSRTFPTRRLRSSRRTDCASLSSDYETGSQKILNNIRKGTRIDIARRFTEDCHRLGITIHGTFIVGLPGESRETLAETIRFAREINPHTIQVSLAAPYPGTELYRQAMDNGWLAGSGRDAGRTRTAFK